MFSIILTLRFFLQDHAPEEYDGYGVLDHGVDTYGYGNNIYIMVSQLVIHSCGRCHGFLETKRRNFSPPLLSNTVDWLVAIL
jgi:hypothetical protein